MHITEWYTVTFHNHWNSIENRLSFNYRRATTVGFFFCLVFFFTLQRGRRAWRYNTDRSHVSFCHGTEKRLVEVTATALSQNLRFTSESQQSKEILICLVLFHMFSSMIQSKMRSLRWKQATPAEVPNPRSVDCYKPKQMQVLSWVTLKPE